ncbi:MAG: Kazal-type serine protease inhibitor [Chryseolinea sp.]
MKKLFFILFILSSSCENDDINKTTSGCIDPEKWGEITACPEYIDQVCGCDSITYTNECFAKAAGVVSWTKGECK